MKSILATHYAGATMDTAAERMNASNSHFYSMVMGPMEDIIQFKKRFDFERKCRVLMQCDEISDQAAALLFLRKLDMTRYQSFEERIRYDCALMRFQKVCLLFDYLSLPALDLSLKSNARLPLVCLIFGLLQSNLLNRQMLNKNTLYLNPNRREQNNSQQKSEKKEQVIMSLTQTKDAKRSSKSTAAFDQMSLG